MKKFRVIFNDYEGASYSFFVKYNDIDTVVSHTYYLHNHILCKIHIAEICVRIIK